MSNIHGLFSNRDEDDNESDAGANRYVGGNDARGGGSGLAVQPQPDDDIFGRAEHDANAKVSRKITMYKSGFQVDDGPYRRLDDPENAEFLRAMAAGIIPQELRGESGDEDINVGLIDKRDEEYVETFSSFSGEGNALGGSAISERGIVDVTSDYFASPPEIPDGESLVSIQVRLLNGKRIVIKLSRSNIVGDLCRAIHANPTAQDTIKEPYVLSSGFPPRVLEHMEDTIVDANLVGAVVTQKRS